MFMIRKITLFALVSLVLISALAVVNAKHQGRKAFVALEGLRTERQQMDVEWGRLQLEQATWATHGRVEQMAREKLGMMIPPVDSVVLVKP